VLRNERSRQRLRQVIARASGDDVSLQAQSAIATILAHLAFWDRFVYARWKHAADQGLEAPAEIEDAHTQLVNDAGFPQWRMIPFEQAARDVIDVAESLDTLIERIDPGIGKQLMGASRSRLVDRSIHRNEHLAELEDVPLADQRRARYRKGQRTLLRASPARPSCSACFFLGEGVTPPRGRVVVAANSPITKP
jgi:hypothetical protein